MALTNDDKTTMRTRYETWGVDKVREDLRQPARHVFVSQERNDFARDWVDDEVEKQGRREVRKDRLVKVLMVAAAIEFGVAIGLVVPI